YKTYRIQGNPESALDLLTSRLLKEGMVRKGVSESGRTVYLRHPSFFFSSRRPLTCFSELSLEASGRRGDVEMRVGASFKKLRNTIIFATAFIWVGLPVTVGMVNSAIPDFSPFGVLVVPTGFLIHYSLRGSAFRFLKRLIQSAGASNGIRR
ncbi:MAG: hypothetical protein ACYC9O_11780, partial [Candidatus Latescibacterota bacterium]